MKISCVQSHLILVDDSSIYFLTAVIFKKSINFHLSKRFNFLVMKINSIHIFLNILTETTKQ